MTWFPVGHAGSTPEAFCRLEGENFTKYSKRKTVLVGTPGLQKPLSGNVHRAPATVPLKPLHQRRRRSINARGAESTPEALHQRRRRSINASRHHDVGPACGPLWRSRPSGNWVPGASLCRRKERRAAGAPGARASCPRVLPVNSSVLFSPCGSSGL